MFAGLWVLLAGLQQGFLLEALSSLFGDRDSSQRADRHLFREHWHDVKAPFWLAVFGLSLILIAQRMAGT